MRRKGTGARSGMGRSSFSSLESAQAVLSREAGLAVSGSYHGARTSKALASQLCNLPSAAPVRCAGVQRYPVLMRILMLVAQALPGQTTPEGVPSFKLVLVGDGGTGAANTIVRCQCDRCIARCVR